MYVYGKNVAKQMLMDDISIKKAFIYKKSTDSTILKELQDRRIPIKYLEKYELDKMVDGNHQGVVLSIPDYEYCTLDDVILELSYVLARLLVCQELLFLKIAVWM